MVDGEDLYDHLTTMSNLANEIEEVIRANIMDEDFMTIVCFSIMVIPRYLNIVKIVINGLVLERINLINKFIEIKQQQKATGKKPSKIQMTMQALDKRKRKKKKSTCFKCEKEGHFTKEC